MTKQTTLSVNTSRSSGAWYASMLTYYQEHGREGEPVYHDAETAFTDAQQREKRTIDRASFLAGWWYSRINGQLERLRDLAIDELSLEQSEQLFAEIAALADKWEVT